jgi:hypothetical protein
MSAAQLEKLEAYFKNERDQYKLMMEMSALEEGANRLTVQYSP